MNDVMSSLDAACIVFVKITIGVLLLSFSRVCLAFAGKVRGQAPVVTTSMTTTASSTPIVANVLAPVVEEEIELPDFEKEPEPLEVIECGNCHKEIKSEPVNQIMNPPAEVYRCEHCGVEVQVPL